MKNSILNNSAFRYIFEIIVIVFSVTLSFYIQDVLNDREKIELKNKGLEGVLIELEKDNKFYGFTDFYNKQRINCIDSLFNLSYEFKPKYISGMWSHYEMAGNKRFFDALISTGAIEYIISNQLKSELSDYYNLEYMKLKTTSLADNLCFNRFSDRLTDFKMDSIKWNRKNLTLHHFNPNDIKQIRNDTKLKSTALEWSMYMNMEIGYANDAKKRIQLIKKLINQELNN
jgi:hypothetical protein